MMVTASLSKARISLRSFGTAASGNDNSNDLDAFLRDQKLIEGFRDLRCFLDLPMKLDEPAIIATTAALYDEGATSLALGLAASLAYDQCGRVLLADCDFRHPSLHTRFQLRGYPGLTEILAGEIALEAVLHDTTLPQLSVVVAGERRRSAVHAARAMQGWLLNLRSTVPADYVVLALPPVNLDLGTQVLAKCSDVTLVAARGGVTPRNELSLALTHLKEARVSVVVNGADRHVPRWLDLLALAIRGARL